MGRTACTESQCLYKGDLYLTVELYLYPPMGRTACTESQCLYKGDLYLFYGLDIDIDHHLAKKNTQSLKGE